MFGQQTENGDADILRMLLACVPIKIHFCYLNKNMYPFKKKNVSVFNFSNVLASYRHIKLCWSLLHLHLSSECPQIKLINLHHIIDNESQQLYIIPGYKSEANKML